MKEVSTYSMAMTQMTGGNLREQVQGSPAHTTKNRRRKITESFGPEAFNEEL